ncbi:MAG TPA: hypothetical protein DCP71_12290 [Verrucomicrobiales bacterium]|nr:hypothetical protein [Verrucomicrobiales bacterium]
MQVIRHPKLAEDIRSVAQHYAEISERVLQSFWLELDAVLESVGKNPRSHHFDSSGLRRANFRRFPYHLLYEVDDQTIYRVVLRHDRRKPSFGISRTKP